MLHRSVRWLLALALACTALAGAASAQAANPLDRFYDPPSPLPAGQPGELLRSERTLVSAFPGGVAPVRAWRIMYRSTDAHGKAIATTGTLMVPPGPWLGGGRRPLLAYTLGAHGLGPQCTPSYQFRTGTQYEFSAIATYLATGWAVVVPDNEHTARDKGSYEVAFNTASAAHTTLDAARAAPKVGAAGLSASTPLAINGYSQGGHGAAAALERQPEYAPELPLKGGAAGGVPADIRAVAGAVDGGILFGVVPMAVASLTTAYPELTTDGFNAKGKQAVADAKTECMPQTTAKWALHRSPELTAGGKTIEQFFADNADFAKRVDEQRIGRRKPGVPVLTYNGDIDPWIPHAVTKRLASDWCAQGANVRFTTYPLAEHFLALIEGIPQVQTFLRDRVTDKPAPNGC